MLGRDARRLSVEDDEADIASLEISNEAVLGKLESELKIVAASDADKTEPVGDDKSV